MSEPGEGIPISTRDQADTSQHLLKRRSVLSGIKGVVGVATIGAMLSAVGCKPNETTGRNDSGESVTDERIASSGAVASADSGANTLSANERASTSNSSVAPLNNSETSNQSYTDIINEINLLYATCTEDEKKTAAEMIRKQIDTYKKQFNISQRINNSAKWNTEVHTCADLLGFVEGSHVTELMRALIFVESSGIENNETSVAKGLCQLQAPTAEEHLKNIINRKKEGDEKAALLLGKMKFQIVKDNKTGEVKYVPDLFDPVTNIALGMEYMSWLYDRFGKKDDLAFMAYHIGPGDFARMIQYYKFLMTSPDVTEQRKIEELKKIKTADPNVLITNTNKLLIEGMDIHGKKEKVNIIKILSYPQVAKDFAKPELSMKYVTTIAAAHKLISEKDAENKKT